MFRSLYFHYILMLKIFAHIIFHDNFTQKTRSTKSIFFFKDTVRRPRVFKNPFLIAMSSHENRNTQSEALDSRSIARIDSVEHALGAAIPRFRDYVCVYRLQLCTHTNVYTHTQSRWEPELTAVLVALYILNLVAKFSNVALIDSANWKKVFVSRPWKLAQPIGLLNNFHM